MRNVLLHCDFCWETWEGPQNGIGTKCVHDGTGVVRAATLEEAESYCQAISEGIID